MPEVGRRLRMMLAISVRADPVRSVAAVVTATGQYATLPARALGLRQVTNGIVAHRGGTVIGGIGLMVGLTALNRLMAWWSLNVRMRLRENTQLYLDTYLMGLAAGTPGITHFEQPEYLDRMELIRSERTYLANPFNPISWTFATVVATVTVVVILATVSPVLALLPLLGLPATWAAGRADWALEELTDSQAAPNRTLRHLSDLATEPGPAKEVRVFGLATEILGRHHRQFSVLESARVELVVRSTAAVAAAWAVFGAGYAGALLWVIHLAESGRTSPGSVVMVLSLGAQINMQLGELGWNVAWLVRTYRAVGRLVWLDDYAARSRAEVRAVAGTAPVPDTITDAVRFEGVSFSYPGSSRRVLTGLDLVLPAGTTVAVVGENGAGKTTLVKLLTRLYEPTAGRITVDGVDLRRFDIEEWRARVAAGFQDFARFELVVAESVGVGSLPDLSAEGRVLAALERAAASDLVGLLPRGLATQLGREFDGVELSMGQWQKVALGRAMMREMPLVLALDEPTASLDSATEHALFERFAGAARTVAQAVGGITVLVSHRFSTVRMADIIIVMGNGAVAEVGGHDELMSRGGAYAELYRTQAQGYR